MKKLSLAYFGSPDFSANFLEKLITDTTINRLIEVKLIVTQPDKKVGRKQILTPTPVKMLAENFQFPISNFQTNFKSQTKNFQDIDLALVYAYGDLIPKEILSLPKYGFWNIHPSLLPKYRGTSPIATPLINGDKTTGVTIIKMDEEIDHGPIIAQESYTIKDTDYRPDLERKLTDLGFEMFKRILKKLQTTNYKLQTNQQDHSLATYTKKLSKQDGFIEFEKLKKLFLPTTNYQLLTTHYNLFRGLYPWPGIWTILPNGKRLKIVELNILGNKNICSLQIKRVQLEGKNEVDFKTFNQAYDIF
jgi:methionyl-tRNA formyltransferase